MTLPGNLSRGYGDAYAGTNALIAIDIANARAWKQPCRVATTGNVTIATALNAGDTIDGVTLAAGDRVLVWQQTAPAENGVYVVGATPARAPDGDTSDKILGSLVWVIGGTTYGARLFVNTNTAAIVVDTDPVTFEEFASASGSAIPVDHGNMGATETLNLADGTWHRGTLNANCTITVTGWTVDQGVVALVKIAQDGTGGWDITWDADVVFAGDDQPGQAAAAVTWYLLWSDEGDSVVYGAKIGAGGLTVSDEGTPLATVAESIDFVGAGVTASGTGVAKTVTIPGVTEAAVQAVGHYELLMAAGSSPIEPLETGDGLDWLYVWVTP